MKRFIAALALVGAFEARAAFTLPEDEVLLSDYRSQVQTPVLTFDEQQTTIARARLVYADLYAHTELKQTFFGNATLDPVPRVSRLLPAGDGFQLLKSISTITLDLRDLHQSFHWPRPFGCLRSFVPVELGFATTGAGDSQVILRKFSAEKLKNKASQDTVMKAMTDLSEGDVVLAVDGDDVWSAVRRAAYFGAGANDDARMSEALWALTYVSQATRPLPPSDVFAMDIKKSTGKRVHVEIPYLLTTSEACKESKTKPPVPSFVLPPLPVFTRSHPAAADFRQKGRNVLAMQSSLPGYKLSKESTVGSAIIRRKGGDFGYLRIEEFSPRDLEIEETIAEIEKIVTGFETTTDGLIIDVRNNPGGEYGDVLTQYFSAMRVVAQTEEMRANGTTLALLRAIKDRGEVEDLPPGYLELIERAMATGRRYTARLDVNTDQTLNEKGRIYTHPVIILADPNCYSYCDYFSTSMQDHKAAEVWIENGRHTGGGGATVVDYSGLSTFLPSVFPPFPQGADMGIAITSGYRTGDREGVPIENLGADADRIYRTTMNDVRHGDKDLLKALTERLAKLAVHTP